MPRLPFCPLALGPPLSLSPPCHRSPLLIPHSSFPFLIPHPSWHCPLQVYGRASYMIFTLCAVLVVSFGLYIYDLAAEPLDFTFTEFCA